jgi:hypothetical protein
MIQKTGRIVPLICSGSAHPTKRRFPYRAALRRGAGARPHAAYRYFGPGYRLHHQDLITAMFDDGLRQNVPV